ncbi:MAG: FtsX-like permease family protein [Bacillota bacterium]|jgi:putative ABC transport system permease protein
MISIRKLAESRIKYNKSRTCLTVIAIMLTTVLLAGLGTSAVGLLDMQRQQAAATSNVHATFRHLDEEQISALANHVDLEAAEAGGIVADINYEKMNGYLTYNRVLKEGLEYGVGNVTEGHLPEKADEIASSVPFFERMGVEPKIGNTFSIDFRVNGEGQIVTREFTICGILSSVDMSKAEGISDNRIVYSAQISEELLDELISPAERDSWVQLRVKGEDSLNYDEMKARIESLAADIGCDAEKDVSLNNEYLYTMTDPGSEMVGIVGGLALLIIFFSGMVIYSIYYVSVITDVQEIGKLKALGASKKQIKKMLLSEGMLVSVLAIPPGVIIGYLIPYLAFPPVMNKMASATLSAVAIEQYHMFSLPVLLGVVATVLVTVYISLLKPMRMAAKISPVEAIRYQESSRGTKLRKGNREVNLLRLSAANLTRNKRRTVVTMLTMALSCVLFMSLAGVINSMNPEDIARRNVDEGDFKLTLDYSFNDREYPENNLDNLQIENIFNDDLQETIKNIDGVENVAVGDAVLAGSGFESELFAEDGRVNMGYFDEAEADVYKKELEQGSIDYQSMAENNGVIFTSEKFMEEYGLEIGDEISFEIYDGKRQVTLNAVLAAGINDGGSPMFLMPKEVWDKLDLQVNTITDLYITADQDKYDEVKTTLQSVADSSEHFALYSIDEEMQMGRMSVNIVKYPLYVILIMIAVIGFMNLINTMITSIVTRKRELGVLQAIGLSDRQLSRMLTGEGLVFTVGTLLASFTLGNILGYLIFLWGKDTGFMSVSVYHYPIWETVGLLLVMVIGQIVVAAVINKRVHKESLIDRIRSGE